MAGINEKNNKVDSIELAREEMRNIYFAIYALDGQTGPGVQEKREKLWERYKTIKGILDAAKEAPNVSEKVDNTKINDKLKNKNEKNNTKYYINKSDDFDER